MYIYFWLCWVFVTACGLFSSRSGQGLLFLNLTKHVQGLYIENYTHSSEKLKKTWSTGETLGHEPEDSV